MTAGTLEIGIRIKRMEWGYLKRPMEPLIQEIGEWEGNRGKGSIKTKLAISIQEDLIKISSQGMGPSIIMINIHLLGSENMGIKMERGLLSIQMAAVSKAND